MKLLTKTKVISPTHGIVMAGMIIEEDVTKEWAERNSHLYKVIPEQDGNRVKDAYYKSHTVRELRQICKKNDLPVYGTKSKIIKRLKENM